MKATSRATPRPASGDRLSPAAALVRQHDHDRFQTALFAPRTRREALFALYAFNYEVARVREAVREPMLGRIRLQWWREAIEASYDGGPLRRHDVAEALGAAIRACAPTRVLFDRLIDAREGDLDPDPPPTLAALEDYGDATSGGLNCLAAELLGAREPEALAVARDVGIGYALAGLIRAMPFRAGAGRPYIPAELAAGCGLDPGGHAAGRGSAPLRIVVAVIAEAAEKRLAAARLVRWSMPRQAVAVMLPAVIAARFLDRLAVAGHDPFDPVLTRGDPLQSWRLLVASLRRRF